MIGELRSRIVESLHENHRKLIFGCMSCREVLKQIRDRLEPTEDLQIMKIIDDYSNIRIPPTGKKIEHWLMEWERMDIMVKRLKIADFSDYKLTQDFLTSANSLLPMWVTNKRMEIVRLSNKLDIKFLDHLIEFRQFWSLTEFESRMKSASLAASFQGQHLSNIPQSSSQDSMSNTRSRIQPNQPRKCQCGEFHSGEECYYLAEGKAPMGFVMDEKITKKFKEACNRPAFRTFVKKSAWTASWLKMYIKNKWSKAENNDDTFESQQNNGTFITSIKSTVLTAGHPLRNEIILDSGADGHVCNNISLATSELTPPLTPTFVQGGSGKSQIVGYGDIKIQSHLSNENEFEMTITNVAFAPDFLTSVVSWKMLKSKGVRWDTEQTN